MDCILWRVSRGYMKIVLASLCRYKMQIWHFKKDTWRVSDSIRALIGAMPDPVANMKTWETSSGPTFATRNPGPSTGLASTSVPNKTKRIIPCTMPPSQNVNGYKPTHWDHEHIKYVNFSCIRAWSHETNCVTCTVPLQSLVSCKPEWLLFQHGHQCYAHKQKDARWIHKWFVLSKTWHKIILRFVTRNLNLRMKKSEDKHQKRAYLLLLDRVLLSFLHGGVWEAGRHHLGSPRAMMQSHKNLVCVLH